MSHSYSVVEKVIFILLLFTGATPGAHALDKCSTSSQVIEDCTIALHICEGFYHLQWQYYGYAQSGDIVGATTEHCDSKQGAMQHAVYLLLQQLPSKISINTCNCEVTHEVIDSCPLQTTTCWTYSTVDEVEPDRKSFKSWTGPADKADQFSNAAAVDAGTGYFCCAADGPTASANAVQDLKEQNPNCFTANPTSASEPPSQLPSLAPSVSPTTHSEPSSSPSLAPSVPPTAHPEPTWIDTLAPTSSSSSSPSKSAASIDHEVKLYQRIFVVGISCLMPSLLCAVLGLVVWRKCRTGRVVSDANEKLFEDLDLGLDAQKSQVEVLKIHFN